MPARKVQSLSNACAAIRTTASASMPRLRFTRIWSRPGSSIQPKSPAPRCRMRRQSRDSCSPPKRWWPRFLKRKKARQCPAAWAVWAAWECNAGPDTLVNEESGYDDFVRAALLFLSFGYECACQLKGSDHGGCDTAVELALAGIEVSNTGWFLQPADFDASPIRRAALYTSGKTSQWLCAKAGTSGAFRCGIKVVPFV